MPKLPDYGAPKVEQRAAGTPYSRLDTRGTHGEAVIGGVERLAGGVANFAEEVQAKNNAARIQDAYAKLSDWQKANLWHPETGIRTRQGENAIGLTDEKVGAYDKFAKELEGSLANDAQKQAFARMRDQERESVFRAVSGHESAQFENLRKQKSDAALEAAVSNGANGYHDHATWMQAIQRGRDTVLLRSQDEGWSPEQTARAMVEFKTKFHIGVLDRLAAENGAEAMDYLKRYEGEIDGIARGKVKDLVGAAGLRDRSRVESDRIWEQAKGDPIEAVDLARKITDTKLFDAVEARLKQRVSEDHAIRLAADSPREARLETGIDRFVHLDRTSPDYTKLSDEGRSRVEAKWRAAVRSQRSQDGEERRQQAELDRYLRSYYDSMPLKGEGGNDRVSLDVDHDDRFARMSPTARNFLKAHQQGEVKDWQKTQGVNLTNFEAQVKSLAAKMDYDKRKAAAFLTAMKDERARWMQDNTGREPPAEEVKRILADAVTVGDFADDSFWKPHALSGNQASWESRGDEAWAAFPPEDQPYLKLLEQGDAKASSPAPAAAPPPPKPTARPKAPQDVEPEVWAQVLDALVATGQAPTEANARTLLRRTRGSR